MTTAMNYLKHQLVIWAAAAALFGCSTDDFDFSRERGISQDIAASNHSGARSLSPGKLSP